MATLSVGGNTLFSGSSIDKGAFPQNSILQVQQGMFTGTVIIASQSFVAIHDDLKAIITPSSTSSKILISCAVYAGSAGGAEICAGQLFKNGSLLSGATNQKSSPGNRVPAWWSVGPGYDNHAQSCAHATYLDSPNTTNPTTYQIYARSYGTSNTASINTSETDGDAMYICRTISTITLMELAG